MRTLSLNLRSALFAQETGIVPIFLLTITHASLAAPIRLSTDPTTRLSTTPLVYGTVSRANQYLFVGAKVKLPDEVDRAAPASKLSVVDVDRELIPLARSISSPASLKIELVTSSDLDLVEATVPALDLSQAQWQADTLEFDLTMDSLANEPYPAGSFDPASFPGLFV